MSFQWTFKQLTKAGSSTELKILRLDDWSAPFGRPRKGELFREQIKSRVSTTYYPGSSRPPTRHAFGSNWEPMEFHGRWMEKKLPNGESIDDKVKAWREFQRDERQVLITWGPVATWTGFLESIEFAYESDTEVVWKMRWLIDERSDTESRSKKVVFRQCFDDAAIANASFAKISAKFADVSDAMPIDLFDSLNLLAGSVNSYQATFNKVIDQVGDIEKAAFSTIQHFRTAVTGFETALIKMRDLALNTAIDSALVVRKAENDIRWFDFLTTMDAESTLIISTLVGLDRRAELASKPAPSRLITARDGDTWESLAVKAYGDPNRGGEIRSLNGGKYGDEPVPGQGYLAV